MREKRSERLALDRQLIHDEQVVVTGLRQGSVLVDMVIAGIDAHVLKDLEQQCEDAGSKLRRGRRTRHATSLCLAHAALPTGNQASPPTCVPAPPTSIELAASSSVASSCAAPSAQQPQLPETAQEGTDLQETRRFALIQKMQRLQQCREECREEAAAAVADLRAKCKLEFQEELEREMQRIRVDHERMREEAKAKLQARLHEQLAQEAQQLELQHEQERKAEDALQLRCQELDAQLAQLEAECAKKLTDARVACEEELQVLLARSAEERSRYQQLATQCQEESLRCEEERGKCERERTKCEGELLALQQEHEAARAAATRAHEARMEDEERNYAQRREAMLCEWREFEQRHAADVERKTAWMQQEMSDQHAQVTARHQAALALLNQVLLASVVARSLNCVWLSGC